MKICLVNPPVEDFYITGVRRQPLGLLYIAGALRSAGYDPLLLNFHSPKKSVLDLPGEFSYLRKYIDHPDPLLKFPFRNYQHFGLSWQEIGERIKRTNGHIFFITSLFTPYYEEAERTALLIRENHPDAFIVGGGYHPSLYAEHCLDTGLFDFVIEGEGETSSAALVQALENSSPLSDVPGLVYKSRGGVMRNGREKLCSIDDFSLPARDLLLRRDFKMFGKTGISMITSRGCPNRCSFCTGRIIWGNRYRTRSIDSVEEEIIRCMDEYGADIINFEDDNIFAARSRAEDILRRIISLKKKRGSCINLTAMNGISIEKIDGDIIALMAEAGFRDINLSLVSHSADVQRELGRPFDSKKIYEVALEARRRGMDVRTFFILGLPEQSRAEIEETIAFLKSMHVKIFPSVFYNVYAPGDQWKMQRSSAFYNQTEELPRDELISLFNGIFLDSQR